MASFKLTKRSVNDLAAIWNYTFDQWSEEQADNYYEAIINHCKQISDHPEFGKNYHGVTKSLFGSKINKHIVFYRIMNNKEIEVARILHERMDLKRRLEE